MKHLFAALTLVFYSFNQAFAIDVKRTIFPTEFKKGQEAIVSVTIKKEGEEGFAKLMEDIPAGFKVIELKSATGNFLFADGKLKIIWLTMPDGPTFTAQYKLVYEGDKTGSYKIDGKFYYVKNNKRNNVLIGETNFKIIETGENEAPEAVTVLPKVEPETKTTAMTTNEEKTEVIEEKAAETATAIEAKTEDVKEEVEAVVKTEKKSAESDLVFKVQLGVFSSEKEKSVFGSLPAVHYEMVGKLYKYYSGNFSSEYEARDNIEKAKQAGFSGAFLVRFKNGKRL